MSHVTPNQIADEHSYIVAIMRKRTNGNLSLADDLAQDVIVRAIENADTLKDISKLRPWLSRLCTTIHLNHCKSQTYRKVDEYQETVGQDSPDALSANVKETLSQFTERQQTIVALKLEGYTTDEIADKIGVHSRKTVCAELKKIQPILTESIIG